MKTPTWDSPEETVEGSVKAQQLILIGYRGNSNTNKKKHAEASMLRHVAINLTGQRAREIREYSKQLTKETGYDPIDESEESRVVLLGRVPKATRFSDG